MALRASTDTPISIHDFRPRLSLPAKRGESRREGFVKKPRAASPRPSPPLRGGEGDHRSSSWDRTQTVYSRNRQTSGVPRHSRGISHGLIFKFHPLRFSKPGVGCFKWADLDVECGDCAPVNSSWQCQPTLLPGFQPKFVFNPTSEVETADDADKQELGGETGRMSPKHAT